MGQFMSKENMLITDGEPCASIRCKHGSGARAARPLAYGYTIDWMRYLPMAEIPRTHLYKNAQVHQDSQPGGMTPSSNV